MAHNLTLEYLRDTCGKKNIDAACINLGFKDWELIPVSKDPATNKEGHRFCSYDPVTKKNFEDAKLFEEKMNVFNGSVQIRLRMVKDSVPQMHQADKCRLLAIGNAQVLDHKNRMRLTKRANKLEYNVAKEKAQKAGYSEVQLTGRQLHTQKKKEESAKKFEDAVSRGEKAIYDEVVGMVTKQIRDTVAAEQKEASIARLKAFQAEQKAAADAHSVAMAAKMQRMRQDAKDAEDRLWEYRMDVQAQVDKKMDRAQECMRKRYNWVNEGDVKEKMAAAQAARDETMNSYKRKMAKRIADMKSHAATVAEKIANQKAENHHKLQQKIEAKQAKFARQRQEVEDHLIRKQQEREEKYEAFCEKLGKTRDTRFDQMQSKSNLARDTRVKAFSSAQSNHKIIQEQKDEKWAGLDEKFNKPTQQIAKELRAAHIQHAQQKDQIYGDLQRRNKERLDRARNVAIAKTLLQCSQLEFAQEEVRNLEAQQAHEKKMLMRSLYLKKEEYDVALYKLKGETDRTKMSRRLNALGMKVDIKKIENKVLGVEEEEEAAPAKKK